MADVSALYTALSGLYAARRGLDVSGQNVANANTEGYSRQRITQESIGAPAVPAIFSQYTGGSGGGTRVSDVQRLRDAFLEIRGQGGHATISDLTTQQAILGGVEQLFPEPGENGLQSLLTSFWNGFDDVANNPGDLAARAQLLQQAQTVTDWLNQASTEMTQQMTQVKVDLQSLVKEVNAASTSLAELNVAILRGQQASLPISELLDQRDQLAMRLAELTGGVTRIDDDGTMGVYVNGATLVRGAVAESVDVLVSARTPTAANPSTTSTALVWARDNSPLSITSGKAHALLDGVNETVPTWIGRLDAVARDIAGQVNGLHTGYVGPPNPPADHAAYDYNGDLGTAFFAAANPSGATPAPSITAANIRLAISDPKLVAASGVAPTRVFDPVTGAEIIAQRKVSRDGSNAAALAALGVSPSGPDASYQTLIVDLGVRKQTIDRRVTTQDAIVTQVDAARESASGVSLDEEMTNILSYQRAYEAASRVITSVDQMLDVLINRTGLVGR